MSGQKKCHTIIVPQVMTVDWDWGLSILQHDVLGIACPSSGQRMVNKRDWVRNMCAMLWHYFFRCDADLMRSALCCDN
jgi:hypothetical protein